MHRWMAAFPNPLTLEAEDDEVIYEDWGEEAANVHRKNTAASVYGRCP